jgi:putative membrane protein
VGKQVTAAGRSCGQCAGHYYPQFLAHLLGNGPERRIVHHLHRGYRIDGCDLHLAVDELLYNDIARQHGADLVFGLQSHEGKGRVAGAQNAVLVPAVSALFGKSDKVARDKYARRVAGCLAWLMLIQMEASEVHPTFGGILNMKHSSPMISLGISMALIAAGIWFLHSWGSTPWYGQHMWQMPISGHGTMMGAAAGYYMPIGMWLFWGLAILALVLIIAGAVAWARGQHPQPADDHSEALAILEKRYARGEIDEAEFDAKRRHLINRGPA